MRTMRSLKILVLALLGSLLFGIASSWAATTPTLVATPPTGPVGTHIRLDYDQHTQQCASGTVQFDFDDGHLGTKALKPNCTSTLATVVPNVPCGAQPHTLYAYV